MKTKIPNIITACDRRVMAAIDDLLQDDKTITHHILQQKTLVTVRTIVRSVQRLSRAGYLDVQRNPGKPSDYKILKNLNNSVGEPD